jgi:hypothetical protein
LLFLFFSFEVANCDLKIIVQGIAIVWLGGNEFSSDSRSGLNRRGQSKNARSAR